MTCPLRREGGRSLVPSALSGEAIDFFVASLGDLHRIGETNYIIPVLAGICHKCNISFVFVLYALSLYVSTYFLSESVLYRSFMSLVFIKRMKI